jgi:hypothetical protein
VKIQNEKQVLDAAVRDCQGRRLGRVAAVDCAPDLYTAAWMLLRLPGWRRRWRAMPASGAGWRAGEPVSVAYRREVVLQSPTLSRQTRRIGLVRRELEAFYQVMSS